MDRLDAMQVLVAVVDAGSLSAGSRKLNAPVQSVSRKVADLERLLGTRLLIRTSRNVRLTDAGRDYVDEARHIVERVQDAELRASGEYKRPSGKLRITATNDLGRRVVLPLACEFLREHPEIAIDSIIANRFVDLLEEHVDVAVRIGRLPDSALFATKVGAVRPVVCASPEYLERRGLPVTRDNLLEHDLIEFLGVSWGAADAGPMPPERSIRFHTNDATAARIAAVEGLGIARLPDYMIRAELTSGELVEILDDYAPEPFPVHLIYMKQGLLPLKVRAFVDWMAPRLRNELAKLCGSLPNKS